jgi:hypothetical protein
MTDKELLEAAARAARIEIEPHPNNKTCSALLFVHKRSNWNPLTDDGDALRLSVQLGIDISFNEVAQCVYADECMEPFSRNPDRNAATRRAIVRAAAEIGSPHNALYK